MEGNAVDNSMGEEVVISGMSGLFPESHNVKDLSDILYNKINPVTKENGRWQYNHPEASPYLGKVPGLTKFDGQFFKVHYRLGINMDSMSRKLLEHTYQAIYDAGISPDELYGKRVGVYIGSSISETEKTGFYDVRSLTGLGIPGCSKSMYANRISYWLNAKGPSINVDEACCSSTGALEQGYLAIKRGECETAIVGGANICLHPQSSINCSRIINISTDGKTKSFDEEAAGCAKSDAINVLFLQKAKNALRIYAEIVHVKCEFASLMQDELGPKYGFYRDSETMANFINKFYEEAKISPEVVEYVEAVGSATLDTDKVELEVIDKVFSENSNKVLLVGSVMSNIGYTEAASGISAIIKVLLGYHHGQLAGNLHCESPRQDVAGLRDGRMRILTDHHIFGRTYAAVNNLSITGINAHILLNGHYKPKDILRYKSTIPHLVTVSGRQESAVTKIFRDLISRPIDPEELALLRNIHNARISGHLGRGFIILDKNEKNETVSINEEANYYNDAKRPLWFVYSGMGSQWPGMGAQLMRIPVFAAAIERCHKILEPKGVDIVQIITSQDKTIFENILNSFVGIAAIQIGLTDILSELEIFPDKIIGHSVGELGCAYADGCFTAEEMIMSAYSRGLVSVQTPFICGSMAAVGMGYQQISKICPPEIEVACHNGPDSSTISGPADIMREFVAQLTAKDIFAKEVPCSNIAYHSRYIADAGPGLLKHLGEVIRSPKVRNPRWISTSVPENRWNDQVAKYSSAEYHTNNLLNSVLFEEASRLIPRDAVLVEIAPHGLLQAILKRSLPDSCKNISLTRRGHPDNALFLLQAIGSLYMEGYNPKVERLYPKVEFPVSTGTPMLSHLVEWAHEEKWGIPLYAIANRKVAAECRHFISVHDEDHLYLKGHVIQENNTYPFAAALVAVWDTLAMFLGVPKKDLSVHFCGVHLHSEPVLHGQRQLKMSVAIHRGTGHFEVLDDKIIVANGFINVLIQKNICQNEKVEPEQIMELKSNDIYEILNSRDYNYANKFRSIYAANLSLTKAYLLWEKNWVTLIDGMIQINALRQTNDNIVQPNFIRNLQIDVKEHWNSKTSQRENDILLLAEVSEIKNDIKCGGIYIENIKFCAVPSRMRKEISLKTLKFVPNFTDNIISENSALYVLLQVVVENLNKREIYVVELIENSNPDYSRKIRKIINDIPLVKINFTQIHWDNIVGKNTHSLGNVDLLITTNLAVDDSICQLLHPILNEGTFVINKAYSHVHPSLLYRKVCAHSFGPSCLELLVRRTLDVPVCSATSAIYTVFSQADINKLSVRLSAFPSGHKIVVITPYPAFAELKDFIKAKKNEDNRKICLVIVSRKVADIQNMTQIPYVDLVINIFYNGNLGGEYYLPIEENICKGQKMALENNHSGGINSLHWIPKTESINEISHPGILLKVKYVSLNDAYIKRVSGVAISDNNNKNLVEYDFSGTTGSNVRVMGIVQAESIGTHVKAKPELLWPVPQHWSLEDAATVPLAYCLAFYCLFFKSRLYHGNSILIHGGAGALGQALISIAVAHNCDIYTTVGSNKKKKILLKLFPELKDDHICSSRDDSFVNMVVSGTNGKGCNIVISCVKQNFRSDSIKCCASFGFIIDTALVMENGGYAFEMYTLYGGFSFTNQEFSSMFEPRNEKNLQKLQLMMSEGIARGFVRPLSRVVYVAEQTTRAIGLQTGSRHLGRVLFNLQDDIPFTKITINCSSDGLQLLFTDDEGLGVKLVERLIRRGARNFDLHCISSKSQYLLFKSRFWEQQGIKFTVSYGSTWNEKTINLLNNNIPQNVEGIYFIVTSNNECDVSKCLEHLTTMIRRSSCIRYFAVIDARKDGCQLKLNQSQGQITVIKLPFLKETENGKLQKYFSKNDAVDAIEKALCSEHDVVTVYGKSKFYDNLLEELASVAGIPIPATSQDVTLKDLGMNISKSQVVQTYLHDEYNILLDHNTIQLLTSKKILKLQDRIIRKKSEKENLTKFFSYVEQDELLAATDMIFPRTLTTSSSKRDDEFDVNDMFLYIIPGVEGLHLRFHALCEQLKLSAMVLQPRFESSRETIQELAQRCAQILLKKAQLRGQFYLLGYESGVLVALEIAAILEEQGLNGTIFCIGGGIEEVQGIFEEELCKFKTEESLQIAVASHMFSLLSKQNIVSNLKKDLKRSCTWKQKVGICVQKLLGNIEHSIQYAHQVIETAYERLVQVRQYNSKLGVPRSLIISIRLSTAPNNLKSQSSLQNHSQRPVVEYELRTPLANAAQDLRCAAIINRHLGKDILEEFANRNLCESYLIDNDSFMTLNGTV